MSPKSSKRARVEQEPEVRRPGFLPVSLEPDEEEFEDAEFLSPPGSDAPAADERAEGGSPQESDTESEEEVGGGNNTDSQQSERPRKAPDPKSKSTLRRLRKERDALTRQICEARGDPKPPPKPGPGEGKSKEWRRQRAQERLQSFHKTGSYSNKADQSQSSWYQQPWYNQQSGRGQQQWAAWPKNWKPEGQSQGLVQQGSH